MSNQVSLEDYPRPAVGVDLAILTVASTTDSPRLCVLVQDRTAPDGRGLPGRFLRERQTVFNAVGDILRLKVNIAPPTSPTRLIRLFDDPDRDDRTWAVSAAHALSVHENTLAGARGDLVPVAADGGLPEALLFDYDLIVREAVTDLRERYETRKKYRDVQPDPDGFLAGPFTLAQLRRLHESVLSVELPKDSFNRRMIGFLRPVLRRNRSPALSSDGVGRPAQLYRKR